MATKVLVIGAGIAGLSAASYLQRNGFDTEILELHDKPGGLCAAWSRGGYAFDGCIHWLMGSGPSSNLHRIWDELGAGSLEYVEWEVYAVVRLSGGETFTVYTDPDRLEAEILRLGPSDRSFARTIAANVRRVSRGDMPAALDKLSLREALSLAAAAPGLLPVLAKWTRVPVASLVERLRSPALREAFSALFGDAMPDFPAAGLFMMLGFMAKRSAGYPIGGSLAFARAIEARYLSLGGRIRYGFKVDRVLVEGGAAVGVAGEKGEIRGDIVVSAADAYDSVRRLLGDAYRHPELEAAFATGRRFPSLLFVGLGLSRDCSDLPHSLSVGLAEPLVLERGALSVSRLSLRVFNFDPTLAPAGKTSASVMIGTENDEFWTRLAESDPAAYADEKRSVADSVIAALDAAIPGFASWVEMVDVATPRTFIRYTNNWHGSYEGWLPTMDTIGRKLPRTLPGLRNFHMVGQWVNPGGGLPPAGIDGRNLAKKLCAAEGRPFRADPPST